ncbi:Lin0368 family putative glycerol transporter subunit [Atopococcus tabaci]|uniref:Lin0368 family putative glycerol transporter subunit n=1 Tax=Atopococcus tabaci TaxID=269774 RepID=UPI00240A54DF|nr:hypothetical protein [Atopococcus tabaci]
MKFFRGMLGYMIAGMIVMSVWDGFAGPYGIAGGYAAAIIIIGPMWFMNHHVGLIHNPDTDAFVDMALGIGVTGIVRDIFLKGAGEFVDTLPTLLLVTLGAVIAGFVAPAVERALEKEGEVEHRAAADERPGPGYSDDYAKS